MGTATQMVRAGAVARSWLPPVYLDEVHVGDWPHDLEAYTCHCLPRIRVSQEAREHSWSLSPRLDWWGLLPLSSPTLSFYTWAN